MMSQNQSGDNDSFQLRSQKIYATYKEKKPSLVRLKLISESTKKTRKKQCYRCQGRISIKKKKRYTNIKYCRDDRKKTDIRPPSLTTRSLGQQRDLTQQGIKERKKNAEVNLLYVETQDSKTLNQQFIHFLVSGFLYTLKRPFVQVSLICQEINYHIRNKNRKKLTLKTNKSISR